MAGNATRELIEKLGVKSLSKGIKLQVENDQVRVAMNVNLRYGYSVPDTSAEIQEKATEASISVDTLKKSFEDTLTALDDISKYKQEALPRIRQTIDDFYALAATGEEHLRRIESASS